VKDKNCVIWCALQWHISLSWYSCLIMPCLL